MNSPIGFFIRVYALRKIVNGWCELVPVNREVLLGNPEARVALLTNQESCDSILVELDFEVQLSSQVLSILALELQLSIDGGCFVIDDERVFDKAVRDVTTAVSQDIQLELTSPLTE